MLTVKIDVTKIDKARLFKGQKGTYLDLVLIPTPEDRFGNSHMVCQSISQEERLAGKKGNIIGNAKEIGGGGQQQRQPQQRTPARDENLDQDVPF